MVCDIEDGSGHFLHIKEGVTQGGPLFMIIYDIGVLPLVRELQETHPLVTQPWYADDAGSGGGGSSISWPTLRTCRHGARQGANS